MGHYHMDLLHLQMLVILGEYNFELVISVIAQQFNSILESPILPLILPP
jgi:hypothetical protein